MTFSEKNCNTCGQKCAIKYHGCSNWIPSVEPFKGMTNGEVIKAVFSNASIHYHKADDITDAYVSVNIKGCDTQQDYSMDWWNNPYSEGSEND